VLAAMLLVTLAVVVLGSGDARATPRSTQSSIAAVAGSAAAPVLRRSNGTRIVFPGRVRAWCGAWNDPGSSRSLHVAVLRRDGDGFATPYWHMSAVAADVRHRRVIRFPVGIAESHPHGALVFATDDRTGNEASTEEDGARGSISFAPVRCVLGGRVHFAVAAVLGSEFGDGTPIRANGRYEGTVGRPPPGWPR